ncbi:MAG: hypothetical protein HOW71_38455 [Nonomuraea sp.]|nr:hypothetical protein [Nonomuraea sp.]NUS09146.1 hypothetical protein [Nonomuraea sp.]
MPETETDELSFGDDREPWLRTWAEAHRRLAALLVAAVVVLAGLGAGGWYLHQRSLLPSPPPDDPFPEPVGVVVSLCAGEAVGCPKGTADQVMKLVREIPEVVSPRLVTADESEMRWAMQVITDEGLAERREVRWVPFIEGGLRSGADFDTVRRRLAGQRGVMRVSPRIPDFWKGKADLSVVMCGGPRLPWADGCGGSAPTAAQRDAVVARLRELDGVDEVFLQDRAFGLRLNRHYAPDAPLTLDDVPETLYVRLDDAAKAKTVGQTMLRMPGVGWSQLIK